MVRRERGSYFTNTFAEKCYVDAWTGHFVGESLFRYEMVAKWLSMELWRGNCCVSGWRSLERSTEP